MDKHAPVSEGVLFMNTPAPWIPESMGTEDAAPPCPEGEGSWCFYALESFFGPANAF